ncbi:CoA transferase [Desulfosporosinus nitroreducens]|uniref:CoA transferase n=1 Tax=Desulfosporosinus nitroreducens TaxID=2018668 RepID=UPI00207C59A0|nr:CoA transferase [Desulfosporosinus nitroreducens]MCO1602236.1 CoA transferase [Desulfosporosinus nitroreducens]
MAVTGILSAYIARQQTGKGEYIDVSMLDGAVSWMAMLYAQQAQEDSAVKRGKGMLNGGEVCYGVYETSRCSFYEPWGLRTKILASFLSGCRA